MIETSYLELIGADADTHFEITTDGHALILTPVRGSERSPDIENALSAVNESYSDALRKLSK